LIYVNTIHSPWARILVMNALQQKRSFGAVNNSNVSDPRLIESMLANLALFQRVPRANVATIASHARVQGAPRGTVLSRQGEMLPGILVLACGSAKLSLRLRDGEEKVVRFLSAGDTFGEAAAMHDRPCPVEAVALEDSMVVLLPPLPLLRLFEVDPQFARNLARTLADKFLNLLAELEAALRYTALQRLAAYLESLAEPNGGPGTWIARLPASKTAVAARLGITKETMSRLLRELVDRGLIVVDRRDIKLRDLQGLAQVAH